MTEKIIYIANNGREFGDKEECLKYEKSLNDFLMFDTQGRKVNSMYDCSILIIKTDEAAQTFARIYGSGYTLPWDEDYATSGAWFWSDETDSWITYDYVVDTVHIIDKIRKQESLD